MLRWAKRNTKTSVLAPGKPIEVPNEDPAPERQKQDQIGAMPHRPDPARHRRRYPMSSAKAKPPVIEVALRSAALTNGSQVANQL